MKLEDNQYLLNKGYTQKLKYHASNSNGSCYTKVLGNKVIQLTHIGVNTYTVSVHIKGGNTICIHHKFNTRYIID